MNNSRQNINSKKGIGSSQDFVPIREIKDGFVVLDDGTLVSVSLVTSINLSLKSQEEQASVIASFQAFINLLEFPVQISIQSRKLDINPYLDLLEQRLKEQTIEIIKLQTIEYIGFIKNFTDAINIMDKQFFLVVSYKPITIDTSKKGFLSMIGGEKKTEDEKQKQSRMVFEEAKSQLEQRVGLLTSGLSRTGVKIKKLDTEAALEVFYSTFNPTSKFTAKANGDNIKY
ncbi:hypothetical protein CSB11_02575 [Candidatus Campbellbacteria bacterium]|nr:MAG: hypothetical protein CSB11_02575 [Candidatus Campbellbacteria bacterium]